MRRQILLCTHPRYVRHEYLRSSIQHTFWTGPYYRRQKRRTECYYCLPTNTNHKSYLPQSITVTTNCLLYPKIIHPPPNKKKREETRIQPEKERENPKPNNNVGSMYRQYRQPIPIDKTKKPHQSHNPIILHSPNLTTTNTIEIIATKFFVALLFLSTDLKKETGQG